MYLFLYTYICTFIYIYINMCVCMYVCTLTYIYTHIYIPLRPSSSTLPPAPSKSQQTRLHFPSARASLRVTTRSAHRSCAFICLAEPLETSTSSIASPPATTHTARWWRDKAQVDSGRGQTWRTHTRPHVLIQGGIVCVRKSQMPNLLNQHATSNI